MSYVNPIWLEGQRKRWQRHDWQRFIRHDAHRFLTPAGIAEEKRAAEAEQAARGEAEAAAAAEHQAFYAEHLELRRQLADVKFELAFRRIFRKYSPDQPRDDRGRWTDGGGRGGGGAGGEGAETGNESLEQDRGAPLTTAREQATRDDLPQLEAIANEPLIRSRIDEAWTASNPNSTRPQEHGFWISRNELTGEIFTRPFANPGFANTIVPGSAPSDVVAFFHTHPFGPEFRGTPGPSPSDHAFAERLGLPGVIRSHSGMHYFGPSYRPVRLR
jgi:hypothetical protein